MLPLFAYSQPNAVFKSIRADTVITPVLIFQDNAGKTMYSVYEGGVVRSHDTLFVEDNVSTTIFSVGNDGIVHIQDTSEFLLLAGVSQLDNKNIEIGDNLLAAIFLIVSVLAFVIIWKFS